MASNKEINIAISKLRGLAKEIGNQRTRKRILRKAAKPLVAAAKANVKNAEEPVKVYKTSKLNSKIRAPKGRGKVVSTIEPGTLKKSIGVKSLRKSPDIFVGITGKRKKLGFAFYAHWVEFGAKNVDGSFRNPSPYMRPAVDSTKGIIGKILIEETTKAVNRWAKKNSVK